VLKPETVALMRQNHIGDLNVVTLKTVHPESSNDANLFPGITQKWGLSFDINTEPGPAGRSAGSLAWAGLFNTYFWLVEVARQVGLEVFDRLSVYASRSLVGLHTLEGFPDFPLGDQKRLFGGIRPLGIPTVAD
jgi:methyl acetate hydrolase